MHFIGKNIKKNWKNLYKIARSLKKYQNYMINLLEVILIKKLY